MNENSPVNKNRSAYRAVAQRLLASGLQAFLVREDGIERLEIEGEPAMVYYNGRGAFPPATVAIDSSVDLIAIFCGVTDEVSVYRRDNRGMDTWVRQPGGEL